MEIDDNDGGGQTVTLGPGDRLERVPRSHRHLITPAIRQAFPNPVEHFGQIAGRCPFPQMARWLKTLLAGHDWQLQLHQGDPKEWTSAGFFWGSEQVRSALISLPGEDGFSESPAALRQYYSLVDAVSWMPFGYAGGLAGARDHSPLTEFAFDYHGAQVDPSAAFMWGGSLCGDMLIYTKDGRAGWLCHENGHIHLLGSIEVTINWVYGELLADRCPEYDYRWD